jgi:hypothetical protein
VFMECLVLFLLFFFWVKLNVYFMLGDDDSSIAQYLPTGEFGVGTCYCL